MRLLRILPFLLLAFPSMAMAADICCRCSAPGNPETTCVNVLNPSRGGRSQTELCAQAPKDYTLEGWTCELVLGAECQPTNSGGVCERGPMPVMEAKNPPGESPVSTGTASKEPTPATIPKLNVPIPGLTFIGGESANTETSSLFAQYLVAAYRFGISITALAATIMFVWGAFQYLLGSAIPQIKNGETIMKEAIIGMILVFGATMILRTVNPATTTLKALHIQNVATESYANSLAGSAYADELLRGLGLNANGGAIPTYGIPANCPGRSKTGGGPYPQYAMEARSGPLTQDTIDKYLAEQTRTGIPAAVIMAQMFNESGGACPVVNLFKNPSICGGEHSKNYNFGGIGCTVKQVPSNACAHIAFPTAYVGGIKGTSYPMTVADVNKAWNDRLPNCSELAKTSTRDTYTNCGDKCYPQKSHTSVFIDGKEIWIESVQCSRKFNGPQEFLDSHLAAVRACLPYNDSVYKFAYCIGASTYATAGGKARTLANIIEQNCLCDPTKDSMGCKRDRKLEDDIANAIVQKTNLFKYYSAGKLDSAAYDRIAEALWKNTGGRLTPGPGEAIRQDPETQE